jgi:hypothetical protein
MYLVSNSINVSIVSLPFFQPSTSNNNTMTLIEIDVVFDFVCAVSTTPSTNPFATNP